MSKKIIVALAAAGFVAAISGQASARLNGTTVALACDIAAKEFAGPVAVKNTSASTLQIGQKITVVVYTATGKEYETIVLTKKLLPNHIVRGKNTFQNTGHCTASVFYAKPVVKPRA